MHTHTCIEKKSGTVCPALYDNFMHTHTCIEKKSGTVCPALYSGLHESRAAQAVRLVNADAFEVLEHHSHHVCVTCPSVPIAISSEEEEIIPK